MNSIKKQRHAHLESDQAIDLVSTKQTPSPPLVYDRRVAGTFIAVQLDEIPVITSSLVIWIFAHPD